MKTITIIDSSPRAIGQSAKTSEILYKKLSQNNMKVHVFKLSSMSYNQCIGCEQCFKGETCLLEDDISTLLSTIEASQGIVIISPTYVSNIPGSLKTVIDRSNFIIGQKLFNKVVCNICFYDNHGGKMAQKILNDCVIRAGGKLSMSKSIKVSKDPDERTLRIQQVAEDVMKKIYESKKKKIHHYCVHQMVFHIGIKPYVLKNMEENKQLIKNWKLLGIKI